MEALICPKYGNIDVLCIGEAGMPIPGDTEVFVRVHAATVNRTDLGILAGTPFIIRLFTGLLRPRLSITGTDFAGRVEAIGKNVGSFRIGDRVMGFGGMGAQSHAGYLAAREGSAIVKIPDNVGYDAAACCLDAFYAIDNVQKLRPQSGQKALVIGGTGAIGSSMIQILRFYGLDISAVCGIEHAGLVRSLGAGRIIDYRNDDYTKDIGMYDFVFDAVGKSSFSKCRPLLKKKGAYTSTDGLINILHAAITPLLSGKKVVFTPPKNVRAGISQVRELMGQEILKPVIDRKYPFEKILDAYRYVATGQKIGNVVITMGA